MKDIDNALGLRIIENEPITKVISYEDSKNELDQVKTNIKDIIQTSQVAVQDMLAIAQGSQHPQAYNVLNSLLKTLADLNMDIASLSEKENKKTPNNEQKSSNITNNLFVGTTAELLKLIEDNKKNAE